MKSTKKSLRKEALRWRRSLQANEVDILSRQIVTKTLSFVHYNQANTVMAFLSMPDEPQMNDIIENAWLCGKTVCVPHLQADWGMMDAAILHGFNELITGKLGLAVPDPNHLKLANAADIDLVLVPGVAFDKQGNRLGMGAGYYDRFLPKVERAVLAGVCFSMNVLDYIPTEQYDLPMHYLITELGIVRCSKGKM